MSYMNDVLRNMLRVYFKYSDRRVTDKNIKFLKKSLYGKEPTIDEKFIMMHIYSNLGSKIELEILFENEVKAFVNEYEWYPDNTLYNHTLENNDVIPLLLVTKIEEENNNGTKHS